MYTVGVHKIIDQAQHRTRTQSEFLFRFCLFHRISFFPLLHSSVDGIYFPTQHVQNYWFSSCGTITETGMIQLPQDLLTAWYRWEAEARFMHVISLLLQKQQLSMPRSELCRAVIGAHLARPPKNEIPLDIRYVVLWSDSTTGFTWLQGCTI